MRHRQWWWRGMVGLLLLAGAVGGCDGDAMTMITTRAMAVSSLASGNRTPRRSRPSSSTICLWTIVSSWPGVSLIQPDVDSYRVFVQETLTLVVTLEHSPFVDFDVQLFDADTGQLILDCGINVVPEGCVVPFVVRGLDIAVDVVVTSFIGAGTYTLTLDAQ